MALVAVPSIGRGVLYPARLPTFHRELPGDGLADFVRWFWIPEWDLAAGRTSRQQLLAFPACNLVIEADAIRLSGPTTRVSHRDLVGRGWAVGALLRPAAVPAFTPDVSSLRDSSIALDEPLLLVQVRAAMEAQGAATDRRSAAIRVLSAWLRSFLSGPDDEALLANRLVELAECEPQLASVPELADRLGVSVRTAQRLAARYVGLSPAALIRRRRLQAAAERLRQDPGTSLAELAAELGYADHAHLCADFRTTLGFTPSGYRADS